MEDTQPKIGICESCGAKGEIFYVPHHQEGNRKIWQYCENCKNAHTHEVSNIKILKELQLTHPQAASTPGVLTLINEGRTIQDIKKYLDLSAKPVLEAEVIEEKPTVAPIVTPVVINVDPAGGAGGTAEEKADIPF